MKISVPGFNYYHEGTYTRLSSTCNQESVWVIYNSGRTYYIYYSGSYWYIGVTKCTGSCKLQPNLNTIKLHVSFHLVLLMWFYCNRMQCHCSVVSVQPPLAGSIQVVQHQSVHGNLLMVPRETMDKGSPCPLRVCIV